MIRNVAPKINVICGHVHKLWKVIPYVVNVGVDVWDYRPVSFENVINCFRAKQVEMELFDWEEVIGAEDYDDSMGDERGKSHVEDEPQRE